MQVESKGKDVCVFSLQQEATLPRYCIVWRY